MISRDIVINNEIGLYARAATKFIQRANEYKSTILIEKDEHRVNAKSLLGVLSMGIVQGTKVTIIAEGPDEREAADGIERLVKEEFKS